MGITAPTRRQRPGPRPEDRRAVGDQLVRTLGLRVDWDRLADDEASQLVETVQRADTQDGFNLASLGRRDTSRLEKLLEKGANLQPGHLDRQRKDAASFAEIQQLAAKARAKPVTRAQEGALLAEIHKQLTTDRALWVEHLAVLVAVLAQFAAGQTVAPGARFEGDALVFLESNGLLGGAIDPNGRVGNLRRVLAQLAANQWIEVERNGAETAIRVGRRARRVLGLTKAKAA